MPQEDSEGEKRTERQSSDGKGRWADSEERANAQSDGVTARCAKFTGTAVAWMNRWKAAPKGLGNTQLQWLDRAGMAGTVGTGGTISTRTEGRTDRGETGTLGRRPHAVDRQTDKANAANDS